MNTSYDSAHRHTHSVIAFTLLILALSGLWLYRAREAAQAAEFAPADAGPVFLPAGTAIKALTRNEIPSAARAGYAVTALVSRRVAFEGRLVIPAGAQLRGTLEKLSASGTKKKAVIRFTGLCINGRSSVIQTQPVEVIITVKSDIEVFSAALRTLLGVTLGTAMGSSSRDKRMIDFGLLAGLSASTSVESLIPITVTLTHNLVVW